MKKMKKTLYIAGFIGLFVVAAGCAREQEGIGASASRPEESTSSAVPGMIRLKVNEDLAETLIAAADEDGNVSAEAAAALRIEGVAVKAVSTTFHIGGPFLKQQKESGLHRWFDVEYDKTEPVSKAASGFSGMDGIDWIEPIYIPVKNDVKMNDPDYSVQWHYHNTGQGSGRKGIDMKLQEAWDQYGMFGNSNVIVAILDSGVDYDHPDLAGNVWTNEAELNGTPGVDDDGNGYKDDVHGYNFVAGSAEIHPEDHGTHVAGTVGAVNNNGVGVCGVAGGRYPEKGVRLMCLQIMDATLPDKGASLAKVMQYAAENGAVIAQNSWGYKKDVTTMPSADKDAIDYFIEKAGMKDGKQVGPMAGGLVVFAAGNDSQSFAWPAQYDKVLSVASIGPDGKAAYYTNYGDWVDVCAPGGNMQLVEGGVYSTLPGGKYGYLQGTSMACPHVSGLAALVLSACGGPGYTNQELFKTIVNSSDETIYKYNMTKSGQLGKGMINAFNALSSISTVPPEKITHLEVTAKSNSLTFTADLPKDPDADFAYCYKVYYSTSPFTELEHSSAMTATFVAALQEKTEEGYCKFCLSGLKFNTDYYYGVVAADFAGNESPMSEITKITTGGNTAPVITVDNEAPVELESFGKAERIYTGSDPDGHAASFTWTCDEPAAVTFTKMQDDVLMVEISGVKSTPGEHKYVITLTDQYDLPTVLEVPYVVKVNHVPAVSSEIGSLAVNGIKGKTEIDVNEWFTDEDNESLFAVVTVADRSIVSTVVDGGKVTFTGRKVGRTQVTLTAADAKGESAAQSFTLVVRDASAAMDVYPNPATDYVNVRPGVSALDAEVVIYNAAGSEVSHVSATLGINSPLKLDVKSLAPGRYTVEIRTDGKVYGTSTFVKK